MEFPTLRLGRSCALSLSSEPAYVLSFACQSATDDKGGLLAAAISDSHTIKVYDQDTFCSAVTLEGHSDTITNIMFDKNEKDFLWSSSMDGTLRLWDISAGGSGKEVFKSEQGITCFDINSTGKLLSLALEQDSDSLDVVIHFMDIGDVNAISSLDVLATFDDVHSDDVTKVLFHPQKEKVLFTASMDGLVSVLDLYLSSSFDEDICLLRTLNVETSISNFGFFGPSNEFIFVLTHIETLQLWDFNDAELILGLTDVRKKITDSPYTIDYIIDCVYHETSQRLFLVGGTNSGTVNLFHVNLETLEPVQSLSCGHSEVVRCLIQNEKKDALFSGAEDGMICGWVALKSRSDGIEPKKGKSKASAKDKANRSAKAKPYTKNKNKKSV